MNKVKQHELNLSYEPITSVVNRIYLRENFKSGAKQSYMIPTELVLEREGFNDRIIYDGIDELKDSILVHGLETPLTIDVLHDGRIFVEQGHRRLRAIRLAQLENSSFMSLVECYVNSGNVTELERTIRVHSSNQYSKNLNPLERANNVFKIKHNFGVEKSNDEISKILGVSRQTIDNLIEIASAPDDVKHEMREMKMVEALSYVRSFKKRGKEADFAEEQSHVTSSAKTAPPRDDLAEEMKELEAADRQAEDYKEAQERLEEERFDNLTSVADEVLVLREELEPYTGKRIAKDVMIHYTEQVVHDDGEIIDTPGFKVYATQGTQIDQFFINDILNTNIESIWIFKVVTASKSVFTQSPEVAEKMKYDEYRPEIKAIQAAIRNFDKIEAIVSKLDVGDQIKKDIAYQVHWAMLNLMEARDYIHKNKKR